MKAPSLELTDAVGPARSTRRSTFTFEVSDVTGTSRVPSARFQRTTPAGAAARALAAEMELPQDVTWALRDDRGGVLEEDVALGDQIETGAKLTLTPKAHLG
jgi:hypothetical protein